MTKPSIPQGTRDFPADVIRKRNYIFSTIRSVFELFGFEPLETPAMENLETLMGKYGDEGDKLIFKILNNGLENPAKLAQTQAGFTGILAGKNNKDITERALRYDLTIPFARYVAMNHGKLNFPFKRYQIQPVWRADRPQRGRYREFYQCDADIVGSLSLVNEAELASLYHSVFKRLRVPVSIKVNNRKILAALANRCGGGHLMTHITVAIDKLDKIGIDKVKEELVLRGLEQSGIDTVSRYLSITGSEEEKMAQTEALLGLDPEGSAGIAELKYIHSFMPGVLETDLTLARGLNYYTGTIFEVKAMGVQMGSIGGGGRYDDLTGLFGVPNVPGVGISFGVDRIYDVMEELKLMPEEIGQSTRILFFNLGEAESRLSLQLMQELRENGISCELYPEKSKFDKQFKYAEKKNIPFVAILGEQELASGTIMVKDRSTGLQEKLPLSELIHYFLKPPTQ